VLTRHSQEPTGNFTQEIRATHPVIVTNVGGAASVRFDHRDRLSPGPHPVTINGSGWTTNLAI
jgi:hypothetical protein